MDIWMWQLGTYTPSRKGIIQNEDGSWEQTGVDYPFREGAFDLRWLAPYHPDHREYWDIRYTKPER